MDVSEVNQKLRYVIELLGDLWHYHQAGAHACSCSVCTKKQSLARSIIAKALQEVVVIADCFESNTNSVIKNTLPSLNNSSFSCGMLPTEQDVENTVLKDTMPITQGNTDAEINSSRPTQHNKDERKSSSVSSDSLRDSGLNTSLSSQSISPVGRCQYRLSDNTQLQVSDLLNEISSCDVVNLTQSPQDTSTADTFSSSNRSNRLMPGVHRLSNVQANRSSHLPTRRIFTGEDDSSDTTDRQIVLADSQKAQTSNFSPNNQDVSTKAQSSSFSPSNQAGSSKAIISNLSPSNQAKPSFASQGLMFLSFPIVSPPAFMDKLEDYCRHSKQMLSPSNAGCENTISNMNQPCSHQVHVTQIAPVLSIHSNASTQADNPLVNSEEVTALEEESRVTNTILEMSGFHRGSLHRHLSMQEAQHQNPVKQQTNRPLQDEHLCSLRSRAGVGCVVDVDKAVSHCHKESPTEQLHCIKSHAGCKTQSKSDSTSTETISCTLSTSSLKEEEQSPSASYKDDGIVDSCNHHHHHHQLISNTAGNDDCVSDVDTPSSFCCKESNTEQQLDRAKPCAGSNDKSKLDSSSTEMLSCSLSVSHKEEKPVSSSSVCDKNDDNVNSCYHHHHHHQLFPDAASNNGCGCYKSPACARELCENTNCQDDSHFVWRPWQAKDMIVGLINSDSDEDKQTPHETTNAATWVHSDKHVPNATDADILEPARMIESVNSTHVRTMDNVMNTTLVEDTSGSGQQPLLSSQEDRTEHTHQTLNKKNSKRNMSQIPRSRISLPSGNISQPHNVKFNQRSLDNQGLVAAGNNDVGMVVRSEKSLDIANIKIIDEHNSDAAATDETAEQPSSMDRSLKCLSNIVQTPKNKRCDIYNSSVISPEVFSRSLSLGKENSNMFLQKPDCKPASRKVSTIGLSTYKPVYNERLASSHEILPTVASVDPGELSDVKTQLNTASALDLPVSREHVSQLFHSAVTQEVDLPVSHVRFTQSEYDDVNQGVDMPVSHVRFTQSASNTVNQGVDTPVSHVRFTQSEYNSVKHNMEKNGKLSLSMSPDLTATERASRPITSKPINQIPWGAPAVMVEPNLHTEHEQTNCQVEKPPTAHLADICKPVSNKPATRHCELKPDLSDEHSTSEATSKSASSNRVTFITDRRDKVTRTNGSLKSTWKETPALKPDLTDKHCTSELTSSSLGNDDTFVRDTRVELTKTNISSKSTWKETPTLKTSRNNLNQTLPARKALETRKSSVPKMINESYEANQSFPKVTKSHQSVSTVRGDQATAAVCSHGVVTGIHQLASEWPSKPVPRNRRSVFGFSPPGPHCSPEFPKPDANFKGQVEVTQQNRKSSSGDESGFRDLWSLLDISDDIGQIPGIQEVLFNCVTSSLCIVDSERNGKILSLNESFQLLIGVHEKVVGQKLFRFIKLRDFVSSPLGQSLPQSFVLADGRTTSITGKLAHCVNASGEAIPVSVWTVPFKPQPRLTVCVIGVTLLMQADVYLSGLGQVLMYSQPFEDIVGSAKEGEKATYRIPDVDYSQGGVPQHIALETRDGCYVSAMLTLISDPSVDAEIRQKTRKSDIYPAVLSVSMNLSGLLVAGSDGVIKFWDKNYFRINLGHSNLEDKLQVSDFLSEIMRVSPSSTASSPDSSPVLECKLNSTGSNLALADISCIQSEDAASVKDRNIPASEFYLPQSCFSSHGLVDLDDSVTGESDDDDRCNTSVIEGQDCLQLPVSSVPYQTSTPCKGRDPPKHGEQKDILMEKGTYVGYFLHGDGSHIPVTFKLSHLQTTSETLFCLWVCIMPGGSNDDSDPSSNEGEDDEDENEAAGTFDEEELGHHLRNLHLNKPEDTSLSQMMMMDQAGFNQSHNATSDADLLDLEVAVGGSFGNKYAVCEALGQGSFGFVRRAKVLGSASTVVVKFIKKSHMFEDSWMNNENSGQKIPLEVAILRETYNEHIIKLLDFYENDSFVQMVMEDFGETDLFDFIDQVEIDEPLACHLFRQILWAVDYLHSKKIIHRDIKDENVIVSRSFHCKLIDFGSATYMLPDGEKFTKFRGTLEYCSPEVHNGEKYRGPELDVWALGVTLYTILFRENPFTASEVPGTLTDLPHPITEDAVMLLLGLLQRDPLKRFTVLRALACDWLRQIVDLNNYSWCDLFGDVPTHSESMFELDH